MNGASYTIEFVGDRHRPEVDAELAKYGLDWAFCRPRGDGTVLYIRSVARDRSDTAMAELLEWAWAGYRALEESDSGQLRAAAAVAQHDREAV